MILSWLNPTVDHIVSDLGNIAKRLERHAAEKEAKIINHMTKAFQHKKRADDAKLHSERATSIAAKINALLQ